MSYPATKAAPAPLPRVVVVGRPNVGKSTLANRLCGRRVSIVEPTAGVTRDRVSVRARLELEDGVRWVEVVDTGGVGVVDRDDLSAEVERQIRIALESADLVLLVVDGRDGVAPLDREVADRLRGFDRPVLLVVNKVETAAGRWETESFHALGVGEEVLAVSAQNAIGLRELAAAIDRHLPPADPSARERVLAEDADEARRALRVAVVGRRNAGKSTLVNALAREERVIVSEVPGTTRDAVDVWIERPGPEGVERYVLIDTAGIRKRKSLGDAIDVYGDARARKAIRRADVVLLLFDASEPLSGIEKRLAELAVRQHKPIVLGANKWDLARERGPGRELEPEDFREYLGAELPGLAFAPVSFLAAKDGFQVFETLDLCRELDRQAGTRVSTGALNRAIERATEARSPSARGHRVRVYYATQAERRPPTFVLFVNDPRLVDKAWLRYLENRLREALDVPEVPLRIVLRSADRAPEGARRASRGGARSLPDATRSLKEEA